MSEHEDHFQGVKERVYLWLAIRGMSGESQYKASDVKEKFLSTSSTVVDRVVAALVEDGKSSIEGRGRVSTYQLDMALARRIVPPPPPTPVRQPQQHRNSNASSYEYDESPDRKRGGNVLDDILFLGKNVPRTFSLESLYYLLSVLSVLGLGSPFAGICLSTLSNQLDSFLVAALFSSSFHF